MHLVLDTEFEVKGWLAHRMHKLVVIEAHHMHKLVVIEALCDLSPILFGLRGAREENFDAVNTTTAIPHTPGTWVNTPPGGGVNPRGLTPLRGRC